MALATLCWALASCSDDTFNREYGEGMGYLRLQLGKVDVDLSSTTRAEAGSLPDELIPQTFDDFMIFHDRHQARELFRRRFPQEIQ